jgi:hypothetical protein
VSKGGQLVGLIVVAAGLLGDAALLRSFHGHAVRRRARRAVGDLTVGVALALLGLRGVLLRSADEPGLDALVALVGLAIGAAMLWSAVGSLRALRAGRPRQEDRRDSGALRVVAWVWLAVLVAFEAARG